MMFDGFAAGIRPHKNRELMDRMTMSSRTRRWVFLVAVGYTLVIPASIVFLTGGWKEAATLGLLGVAVIVLTRLEDIEFFKLWGMETKLRETIDEASVKVEQLRSLAGAIAKPAVNELATHGSLFRQLRFSYRYNVKLKIDNALIDIGVSPECLSEKFFLKVKHLPGGG